MNGPPGVGKSTIACRLRDDRPLSLLVDFDELWPLIGDWRHNANSQDLAIAAGLAMARAHLRAGHDELAPQFATGGDFYEAIATIVGETSADYVEIVLTGDPERVASQFRRRRAERTLAGEVDVSDNIAEDRVDEVIASATAELVTRARTRPHARVIPTDGGVDATYARVCGVIQWSTGSSSTAPTWTQ